MSLSIIEELLEDFFDHQILIKMYHFQTKHYSAHNASDDYLAKFLVNFDRFMESAQGNYGKIKTKNFTTSIDFWTDNNIDNKLEKFAKKLTDLSKDLQKDNDLLAIRDEMLADLQQFRYLLTFK